MRPIDFIDAERNFATGRTPSAFLEVTGSRTAALYEREVVRWRLRAMPTGHGMIDAGHQCQGTRRVFGFLWSPDHPQPVAASLHRIGYFAYQRVL
jgi:hypothetical protein